MDQNYNLIWNVSNIFVCCNAVRQLAIRQLNALLQRVGSFNQRQYETTTLISNFLNNVFEIVIEYNTNSSSNAASNEKMNLLLSSFTVHCNCYHFWTLVSTMIDCCALLSSGEIAINVFRWLQQRSDGSNSSDDGYNMVFQMGSGSNVGNGCDDNDGYCGPFGSTNPVYRTLIMQIVDSNRRIAQTPTVRVINLRRRKDRWDYFLVQAIQQSILVLRAVVELEEDGEEKNKKESSSLATPNNTGMSNTNNKKQWGNHSSSTNSLPQKAPAHSSDGCNDNNSDTDSDNDSFYFGSYAYDGLTDTRLNRVTNRVLSSWVETCWRPNDLSPFDRYAPEHENLVRASNSERACALSHIAAWKGVLRSLQIPSPLLPSSSSSHNKMLQVLRISGYATGVPLIPNNNRKKKRWNLATRDCPVCVILEDDAVLVDRFADRLSALLEELPRDFHFCSIGYSRPKTAPIVDFSEHLGIPTCLWYLTGYILSLEGAKYLLKSLPCVGPVDSWIGLKMFKDNWDNMYGTIAGVGTNPKPLKKKFTRKDFAKFVRFRAFCAKVPLCSQRGGGVNYSGLGVASDKEGLLKREGGNWRLNRDTDITYSGNSNY